MIRDIQRHKKSSVLEIRAENERVRQEFGS